MKKPVITKLALAIGAGAMLAVALPLAASAHVEVTPNTAAAGSYADITLRVPNESATATTTKVEVDIPAATPFSSVSYVSAPGWDAELVRTTLPKPVKIANTELTEAVTKVIWRARPGSEIAEGEIRLFTLAVGAVPDTGKIRLGSIQTYSDGSVVKWTDRGEDAEHPSPVLYVKDVPPVNHDADAITAAQPAAASSGDALARVLGIGGLVVGAIGVVVAVVSLRRQAAS